MWTGRLFVLAVKRLLAMLAMFVKKDELGVWELLLPGMELWGAGKLLAALVVLDEARGTQLVLLGLKELLVLLEIFALVLLVATGRVLLV